AHRWPLGGRAIAGVISRCRRRPSGGGDSRSAARDSGGRWFAGRLVCFRQRGNRIGPVAPKRHVSAGGCRRNRRRRQQDRESLSGHIETSAGNRASPVPRTASPPPIVCEPATGSEDTGV